MLRIIASANPRGGGPSESTLRVGVPLARLGCVQEVATLDPPDARFIADAPVGIVALGDRPVSADARQPWLRALMGARANRAAFG